MRELSTCRQTNDFDRYLMVSQMTQCWPEKHAFVVLARFCKMNLFIKNVFRNYEKNRCRTFFEPLSWVSCDYKDPIAPMKRRRARAEDDNTYNHQQYSPDDYHALSEREFFFQTLHALQVLFYTKK